MDLRGVWQNQYGSTLVIEADADRQISGRFRTALRDSDFFGREVRVMGVRYGEALSFMFGGDFDAGTAVCAFSGRLEDGRLETVWHVVTTTRPWPHAVVTNADTFNRVHADRAR